MMHVRRSIALALPSSRRTVATSSSAAYFSAGEVTEAESTIDSVVSAVRGTVTQRSSVPLAFKQDIFTVAHPLVAAIFDERDKLAPFRQQFHIPRRDASALVLTREVHWDGYHSAGVWSSPGSGAVPRPPPKLGDDSVYLCGNSLGLQPKQAAELVSEEMGKWSAMGVKGHFSGARPWADIDDFVHQGMGRVVGAPVSDIAVMNSLTVNLHLMMIPFYRPDPPSFSIGADTAGVAIRTAKRRHKIVIEDGAFPSDNYAVASQLHLHGLTEKDSLVRLKPRPGEHCLRSDDILEYLEREGDQVCLLLLPGVQYYSGQAFPIKTITKAAKRHGIVVGWDLAHAAGNLFLQLAESNADWAAWCSYKYLNSGPGATAAVYVNPRHSADPQLKRLTGWWGNDPATRFKMAQSFDAASGAASFKLSNPPVLPMVCLAASLATFDSASMSALAGKSRLLTGYLHLLLKHELGDNIQVLTPADPAKRGCQLSLSFKGKMSADDVNKGLEARGVICDTRQPNVVRVAPAPLYNTFTDVRDFVFALKDVLRKV